MMKITFPHINWDRLYLTWFADIFVWIRSPLLMIVKSAIVMPTASQTKRFLWCYINCCFLIKYALRKLLLAYKHTLLQAVFDIITSCWKRATESDVVERRHNCDGFFSRNQKQTWLVDSFIRTCISFAVFKTEHKKAKHLKTTLCLLLFYVLFRNWIVA